MLHTTKGIVIRVTPFRDKSSIVKIYTEVFGLQGYLINTGSKKGKHKNAYYEPLSILELVVSHKEREGLQSIKEVIPAYNYSTVPFDVVKQSILLFMNEVIHKTVHEEQANPELFHFLYHTLLTLDHAEGALGSFHLSFLLEFTRYLGFYPQGAATEKTPFFDLQEGYFASELPPHVHYLGKEESTLLYHCLGKDHEQLQALHLTKEIRKTLLLHILHYFQLHSENCRNLKSVAVLEAVFE
jgi:DNA repair protein RecO (recombination protein O)